MSALVQARPDLRWQPYLPALLLALALLLVFNTTAQAMAAIWYRSGTFAHAFLVLPIALWLGWRQRHRLAGVTVRPAPWLLLPLLGLCLLWLLGELAAAQVVTQFALVAMLVVAVPLTLGLQVARAMLFPLLFLFFAVPAGEALVPVMMEWTADFTVAAVGMSGVPVYREGFQFIVPSGRWSVVEACSGVRYLIASFMVGTLFAYINFASWKRRLLFIVLSLLVPLVANWVRAYMIVMLGHLSNNQLAAGVDHIIYGWVFFGIVIGAMFFVGARWADAPLGAPAGSAAATAAPPVSGSPGWLLPVLAVVAAGATQLAAQRLDQPLPAATPKLALPADWGQGWVADAAAPGWEPAFKGARAVAAQSYRRGDGVVGLWVGYYRDQSFDNKLVTSTNVLAEATSESKWTQYSRGVRSVPLPNGPTAVRVADVQASLWATDIAGRRLRAWQLYWIGGHLVAGESRARLHLALNRLLGRGDDGAAIVLFTPLDDSTDTRRADERLSAFAVAGLPAMAARLEALRAQR